MASMQKLVGRPRILRQLASVYSGLSLNIGSGRLRLGDINIDIKPEVRPDIVADVLYLPFRKESFSLVLFTDVIEHLPLGQEKRALSEIFKVLQHNGTLILSTPNDIRIYSILDPARYITKHRHYSKKIIKELIEQAEFNIEKIFTGGNVWEVIALLWYYFITYPLKRILKREIACPYFIQSKK